MSEAVVNAGSRLLFDTSAVIAPPAHDELPPGSEVAVSAITLAELSAGVHATTDPRERAVRLVRLQRVESSLQTLQFTAQAARMYGQLNAMVLDAGRNPRPRRMDLLIASVAAVHRLPLVTRNGADFTGLDPLLQVIAI